MTIADFPIAIASSLWFLVPMLVGLPFLFLFKSHIHVALNASGEDGDGSIDLADIATDATLAFINGTLVIFLQTFAISYLAKSAFKHCSIPSFPYSFGIWLVTCLQKTSKEGNHFLYSFVI